MLPFDEPIRLQYLRQRVERGQRKYQRGIITQAEFDELKAALRAEEARPRRLQDPSPPLGAKSVRIPMDRVTELALDHLLGIDLGRTLEKAELFRVAVRQWALDTGWEPPEDVLS